jgi:hypothetical protein
MLSITIRKPPPSNRVQTSSTITRTISEGYTYTLGESIIKWFIKVIFKNLKIVIFISQYENSSKTPHIIM